MKVLLVLVALVSLAYGQTTQSPVDACLEDYTTNPANAAALLAIGTNCAGVFNMTNEDEAFEAAACTMDRNSACFTSLNVLIQACNVDIDTLCQQVCLGNYFEQNPTAFASCTGIDFESEDQEAIIQAICNLGSDSACYINVRAGYLACDSDLNEVCLEGCVGNYFSQNPTAFASCTSIDFESEDGEAIFQAICNLGSASICYNNVQAGYLACDSDLSEVCLQTCLGNYFGQNPTAFASCTSIDFESEDREAITQAICNLGSASTCYNNVQAGYLACDSDFSEACDVPMVTKPMVTTVAGSVRVYAVPVFVLISALLSALF